MCLLFKESGWKHISSEIISLHSIPSYPITQFSLESPPLMNHFNKNFCWGLYFYETKYKAIVKAQMDNRCIHLTLETLLQCKWISSTSKLFSLSNSGFGMLKRFLIFFSGLCTNDSGISDNHSFPYLTLHQNIKLLFSEVGNHTGHMNPLSYNKNTT